jgi:hypothetical protein
MGVRTGAVNPPLGVPAFGVAHDVLAFPLGTITQGYDDATQDDDEYIYLQSIAGIAIGDEVDYDVNYLVTEVAAAAGAAKAIVASGANQYAWFKLHRRPQVAP